ncbi:MAG: nuclear transport factor 2 family protein [Acidobacteria bacterium]|nr:nuclear transport factor 2 family protein [Acidobacteriota bacterium]
MKKLTFIAILLLCLAGYSFAETKTDTEEVEKASLNYIEGFYEGNGEKLRACLIPSMLKYGFWKKQGSESFEPEGTMSFEEALKFAANVKEKKSYPKADAPKKVEVLEVSDKIAISKVTAWWGVDYLMLAKNDGKWMIRQILWEGPAKTASPAESDKTGVKNAGLGYIEGFYEGDTAKLTNSLRPKMFKYGYGYNRRTNQFGEGGQMTFDEAIAYAKGVKESKKFPGPDAPKKVEVIDVMNHIAAVKVTAWWGIDYILLSKTGGKWMIEQVLWSGVPPK